MAQYKNTVERRKAEGKCINCGGVPEKGRQMCLPCLLVGRERAKERTRRLKNQGLCIECGKHPFAPTKTRCLECIEKHKAKRKEWKSERLCANCGKANDHDFYVTCNACRGTRIAINVKKQERTQSGICPRCNQKHFGKYKHCESCLDKRRKSHSREKKQGVCPKCKSEVFTGRVHCDDCLELERFRNKTAAAKLKQLVMDAYGGKCVCCHESNIVYLNIDHINNDGAFDRKNGLKGSDMYRHLRSNNWPGGFQVLCFNCNLAKHYQGYCSHEKKDDKNEIILGSSYNHRDNVYFTDVTVLAGGRATKW